MNQVNSLQLQFQTFASDFLYLLLLLLRARQSPCNFAMLCRNLDCFGMAGVLDGKTRWRMRPCWYLVELLGFKQSADDESVSVVELHKRRQYLGAGEAWTERKQRTGVPGH